MKLCETKKPSKAIITAGSAPLLLLPKMDDVMSQVFSYNNLIHAFSGMCGGASAISVFFPLNVARIRLQVSESKDTGKSAMAAMKEIVKEDGVGGLYAGWWPSVVSLAASNFVYFYAYQALKVIWQSSRRKQGLSADITPVFNLVIAAVAGTINVLMTTVRACAGRGPIELGRAPSLWRI